MVTEDQAVFPVSRRCKLTPAHILHRMPGRVRLRIPWIKNMTQAAQWLAGTLRGIEGIHECRANAECASVTISYDPHRWTSNRLLGRLNALSPREIQRLIATNDTRGVASETQQTSWFELSLSSAGVALGLLCEPLAPVLVPLLLAGSALPM